MQQEGQKKEQIKERKWGESEKEVDTVDLRNREL